MMSDSIEGAGTMWKRREWLGVLGTGATGLALLTERSFAAVADEPPTAKEPHNHAQMMKDCDEACGHCEATCNMAFHHCLTLAASGQTQHAKMAQLVIDCAAFCTLSAAMIARHSTLMAESCKACAEACRRCADACSTAAEDEMMKKCVESCRRCEESCRNMVKMMGGDNTAKR
jgi:hypothetical protein